MDRRTMLSRLSGVVIAGIAGCSGDGDGTEVPTSTETSDGGMATPTASTTATDTEMATASPTSTSTEPDGETGSPTDTATPTSTASTTSSPTETPSPTPTASADQVVEVALDGNFTFTPESFTVSVGSTVEWVWRAGGHNVRPDSIPSDSSWTGTEGGDGTTYSSGHSHSHEFTTAGEYEYYCAPHQGLGMTGAFSVE